MGGVSNPYAPPDDRPRAEPGPGDAAPGTPARPTPPQAPPPGAPAPGTPPPGHGGADRSPDGVPYERPRTAGRGGRTPRPEDVRKVSSRTRATALLVLAAVLAAWLPFPTLVVALPLAVAALAVGARALALTARVGAQGAPTVVLALLLGVTVMALARPAWTVAIWDLESQHATCQSGALTVQAQVECEATYEQAVTDRLTEMTRRTP